MTTTPTSGAADLPEAGCSKHHLIHCSQCRHDNMVRDLRAENDRLTTQLAALAAGQATAAPAQPAAQQGAAYAALPDEGEPWRGHKFKEVQRGCWRCDCGKTIKEVTSDQSTPASGGNYPVMPKRYTVDDDGEELFTADKMRAFADATHTLRASHGQAPAETGNSVSAQADSVPAIQGETNVQLDTDPNPTAPGQQRDMACSLALGRPVGNGSDQVAGHPSAQGDKLLTVAERNIRSFLRSATFKSESDREAALNCVDVLWEAARASEDSVLEDAARYRWLAASCRSTSEHWGGRWSIIIDGPAPKSHDSEDDFDAAVDAARKQGATP